MNGTQFISPSLPLMINTANPVPCHRHIEQPLTQEMPLLHKTPAPLLTASGEGTPFAQFTHLLLYVSFNPLKIHTVDILPWLYHTLIYNIFSIQMFFFSPLVLFPMVLLFAFQGVTFG